MTKLKDKLNLLPSNPGCYLMKDKNGKIIYVGKAKVLKNRVRSYFVGSHNAKTTKMVSLIDDFDYIITNNETEALILEMNLIKEHDPKYNILLTDDKTYPYIVLTKEKHPKLEVTRKVNFSKGRYFGPYPNVSNARAVVQLLNSIFPLRKCQTIPKKECLYFHIKQCLAPCIKPVSAEEYETITKEILKFLNGNTKDVVNSLKDKMTFFAENMMFEQAAKTRDIIKEIDKINNDQNINLNDFTDRDIFGFYAKDNMMSVEVFFMRSGKIITHESTMYEFLEDEESAIEEFMFKFYLQKPSPKEVLITQGNIENINNIVSANVVEPKIGDKKKLVEMAINNAKEQLDKKIDILNLKKSRTEDACNELGNLLGKEISRIEAFDNSNISGTAMVSAMVVFEDGKPNRKLYRKYKINTATQQDDYQSMREVVYRRYYRALMENDSLPDLIIVDGGKGQISAAKEILDSLGLNIMLCGLKKDDKHKTSALLKDDYTELPIKKSSNVFHLLSNIQEEVHRFAITYHRQVRAKSVVGSVLDNVKGVGEKTRDLLLKEYNDIYEIKEATIEELVAKGVSKDVASNILEYLTNELEVEVDE